MSDFYRTYSKDRNLEQILEILEEQKRLFLRILKNPYIAYVQENDTINTKISMVLTLGGNS